MTYDVCLSKTNRIYTSNFRGSTYLSFIIQDNSTNTYSVWSICRNSISGFRNPANQHQVSWLGMVVPKSLLPPLWQMHKREINMHQSTNHDWELDLQIGRILKKRNREKIICSTLLFHFKNKKCQQEYQNIKK